MIRLIYHLQNLLIETVFATHLSGAQHHSLITDVPGCSQGMHGLLTDGVINAGKCIPAFIAHVIQFLFGFAGGIFLLVVIWSGYEIVLGSLPGGSSEAGKSRLTWAIIGFILAATSFFIMDFIVKAIGGA